MRRIVMMIALALCLSASVAFGQDSKVIYLEEEPPYYLSMNDKSWMNDYNLIGMNSTGYYFNKRTLSLIHQDMENFMFGFLPDTAVTIIGIAFGSINVYAPEASSFITETAINYMYDYWVGKLIIPNSGIHDYSVHNVRAAYGLDSVEKIKVMQTVLASSPTPTRRIVAEGFFDEPITLSDSFYVSSWYYSNPQDSTSVHWPAINSFEEVHFIDNVTNIGYYPPYDFPLRHIVYKDDGVWHDTNINSICAIWPIIQLNGDVCDEVENLEATQIGGDAMYVTWDVGVNHSRWQVSYGPAGTQPGEGTMIETTLPQAVLTGLPEGTSVAYVRSYCDLARGKWSPWSDAVSVNIGIQDEPQADVPLAVYPNPTKGTFRIEAEATIANVELYDLGGSAVLSLPVNNTGIGIDISSLPEGAYILAAHTASGLATRRIVKQ